MKSSSRNMRLELLKIIEHSLNETFGDSLTNFIAKSSPDLRQVLVAMLKKSVSKRLWAEHRIEFA
jgi:hypothetical protein